MPADFAKWAEAVARERPAVESFLTRLIGYPSLSGQEAGAGEFLAEAFASLGRVEKIPLSDALREDEDFSDPIADLQYAGRHNLRVVLPGGPGKPVLFNTHIDVVPAAPEAFQARCADGVIHGRGACDAKGQIAALYLLATVLAKTGLQPPADVILHLVVEEECGGNGTLAMIRRGESAAAAVVLEPTNFRVFTSVRGAVWFRLTCTSAAGHSGIARDTPTALDLAVEAMNILRQYHRQLLAESRGLALFDQYENPMPLTIGMLHAGRWPASRPEEATLAGVLGLLPNKTRYQVMEEMQKALRENGSRELAEGHRLKFTYRHDAHVLDPAHPLPRSILAACAEENVPAKIDAMTASCDSWFYNNQLGIPTVVFGPGDLKYAHSLNEQIRVEEILTAAKVLLRFLMNWK